MLLPDAHLVGVDFARKGGAHMRNVLWRSAQTEYIATLDDDDVMLPFHLEELHKAAEATGAGITYAWCDVVGRDGWSPNQPFDAEKLKRESYIPSAALFTEEALDELDGWRDPEESSNGWPDWDLYRRALWQDITFCCVELKTWVYVFHGGNSTMVGSEPNAF